MWGRKKNKQSTSLIGLGTRVKGDIHFAGRLHIDGEVRGNIYPHEDAQALLTISATGLICGEIQVPNIIISGMVEGNIYSSQHIELLKTARIHGNVYYHVIEMANGAEVNGNLERHQKEMKALNNGIEEAEVVEADNDPESSNNGSDDEPEK